MLCYVHTGEKWYRLILHRVFSTIKYSFSREYLNFIVRTIYTNGIAFFHVYILGKSRRSSDAVIRRFLQFSYTLCRDIEYKRG